MCRDADIGIKLYKFIATNPYISHQQAEALPSNFNIIITKRQLFGTVILNSGLNEKISFLRYPF